MEKIINKTIREYRINSSALFFEIRSSVNRNIGRLYQQSPWKELEDVLRGIAYTDKEGSTFFQFKSFWRYLLKTKSWADKTYPKQKTLRLLETMFEVKEKQPKIDGKTYRVLEMLTIKLDKPNPRKLEVEKEPWQ